MCDVVPLAVGALVASQRSAPLPDATYDFGLCLLFGPVGVLAQAHFDPVPVPGLERVHVLAVVAGAFSSWPSIAVGILFGQVHSSTLTRRLPPLFGYQAT